MVYGVNRPSTCSPVTSGQFSPFIGQVVWTPISVGGRKNMYTPTLPSVGHTN